MTLPEDVSAYFLHLSKKDQIPITPFKLNKLVYMVYFFHLGFFKERIFNDGIEVWKYGPIVAHTYHDTKRFGDSPIPTDFYKRTKWEIHLSGVQKDLIDKVWNEFKDIDAVQLASLCNNKNSPWDIMYKRGKILECIPDYLFIKHYQELFEDSKNEQKDSYSIKFLKDQLNHYVKNEEYEKAAEIRDQINKLHS